MIAKFTGIFILAANLFFVSLKGDEISVTKEFYSAKDAPAEYRNPSYESDCTVFTLDGLKDEKVWVTAKDILLNQEKQLGCQFAPNGRLELVAYSIGYFPGFPVKYIFFDSHDKKEVKFVPVPISVKSSIDGVQIEAQVLLMHPPTYIIKYSNLKEDEAVSFTSISYDEKISHVVRMSEHEIMQYMPGVIGKRGGVAQLSFTRSTGEVLQLELPWGLEWQKYVLMWDKNQKPIPFIETDKYRKEFPEDAKYFDSKKSLNKSPVY